MDRILDGRPERLNGAALTTVGPAAEAGPRSALAQRRSDLKNEFTDLRTPAAPGDPAAQGASYRTHTDEIAQLKGNVEAPARPAHSR